MLTTLLHQPLVADSLSSIYTIWMITTFIVQYMNWQCSKVYNAECRYFQLCYKENMIIVIFCITCWSICNILMIHLCVLLTPSLTIFTSFHLFHVCNVLWVKLCDDPLQFLVLKYSSSFSMLVLILYLYNISTKAIISLKLLNWT
jgi:hypothetical protein